MAWISLGMKLVPLIAFAVKSVERFIKEPKGQAKEDAAVEMVKAMLEAVEAGAGKDILDDGDVQDATRDVMRAIVKLQNLIAKKSVG